VSWVDLDQLINELGWPWPAG